MNVSLTPKLEEFVRRKVASGLYNNASEVVREALRMLVEREAEDSEKPRRRKAPSLPEVRAAIEHLEPSLRQKGVASLALFGSIMRGEAGPESDIDVLIDVDPSAHFSLFDLVNLQMFLQERLGQKVDIVTREGLDPRVAEAVAREVERVF